LQLVRHRFNFCASSCVVLNGAMTRRRAPQTRYTLRRNAANAMKGLVILFTAIDNSWN